MNTQALDARIRELEHHCYHGGIGLPMTDRDGHACLVFPTGFVGARSLSEIREWRCRVQGEWRGHVEDDERRWVSYGPHEPHKTLAQLLAWLLKNGDIITDEEAGGIQ